MCGKKRGRRKPGDLADVRAVMWEGIEMLEHYLRDPHELGEIIDVKELVFPRFGGHIQA